MMIKSQRGIFLTFMVFLLLSGLLALSITANRGSIEQERNVVDEASFAAVNNRFDNIDQQMNFSGPGSGRLLPFSSFEVDHEGYWIEIKHNFPIKNQLLLKTYDAINLFAIFVEAEGSDGVDVQIGNVLQDRTWGGNDQFPRIEYMVIPQCLKVYVGDATGNQPQGLVQFEAGVQKDGDLCDLQEDSIEKQEFDMKLDILNTHMADCTHDFRSKITQNCADLGDPAKDHYVKLEIEFEGYDPGNPAHQIPGLDIKPDGTVVISANLKSGSSGRVFIKVVQGNNFSMEADGYICKLQQVNQQSKALTSRIFFKKPFDKIVLAKSMFEFAVIKPGFDTCRATVRGATASCGGS